MNIKLKIAFTLHLLNSIAMIAVGCVYVFSGEFMPYHSDVIQTAWTDVGLSEKTLYLGMMRTEGAGFLATALAIGILLFIPFKEGKTWSYWAIPAIGILEYLPTLIATHHISMTTNASPPWLPVLFAIVLFLAGLTLSIFNNNQQSSSLDK